MTPRSQGLANVHQELKKTLYPCRFNIVRPRIRSQTLVNTKLMLDLSNIEYQAL